MYIKQIIIQGFKSYKDQTVIEPFSPKTNVIVGRNGSGKSNFFAAIRFVLGDAYKQPMSKEERGALLHEGSGSAVMTAYVEVHFDNSDDRFPTGTPEVVLRRTIGVKKDEYTLNRKSANTKEVVNLLESAGFSRANPYYIVPQGRVTALTNMKDAERLVLLKEVAGTQVYEARRAESLKIMQDTDNKRQKIDDLLDYIRERLEQLEEEKEELRKYQDKDREQRSLQYTILVRAQQDYQRQLEKIDEQRAAGVDETDENRDVFVRREAELDALNTQINELQQQIEFRRVDRQQLDDERKEQVRERAKIELEINGLTQGQAAAQQARQQHDAELRNIQQLIQQREQDLGQIIPQYDTRKDEEASVRTQLEDARETIRRLRAKQGRLTQFKNKKERDQALQRQIDDIYEKLSTRKANSMQRTEAISDLEAELGRLETDIAEIRSRIESRGDAMQDLASEVEKAKDIHDQLADQRRELYREQNNLDPVISHAEAELRRAESQLQNLTDNNTWRGIQAVRRIKQQYNLEGVYGTLGELFQVREQYQTAVEVTAGQSLFHYVVDTDDTASRVMEILQKDRSGRVTFMPLNRLRSKPVNVPKASDAVHMVSKIQYDPKFEKAFQHVFGKMIICPNLQVASQYARSHGISAITPEGDRADKKGALTGGFHDPTRSRIDAARKEAKWRTEFEAQLARRNEIRAQVERLDQEITRALSEVKKLEQKGRNQDDSYPILREQLRNKVQELQSKRTALESLQRARENIQADERRLGEEQQAYEAEMASAFTKALTNDEEQQLETLDAQVQTLRPRLDNLSRKRSDLEARKLTLEVELNENLRPTLERLQAQEFETGPDATNASRQLPAKQRELKRVEKALNDVVSKLSEADTAIDQASTKLQQLQTNKADLQKKQEEVARRIEHHSRSVEKNMQKRSQYASRLADTNREIRDLGVLPEEAFDKYKTWDIDRILKRHHEVKEALKGFQGVNKKAFEQYNNFTRQKETLTSRRGELGNSHKAIEDLIDHLDMKKDEAIERTFKQVSREFANVFERLVPAGKGRLIIQRKSDRQVQGVEDESDEEEQRRQASSVENYTGVGISVSFNSKHDEQQRIQQLSGGQKSKSHPSLLQPNSPICCRSLRSRPRLRNPTMRSRTLLPLRRDRCQSGRPIQDRSRPNAADPFGFCGPERERGRAVHLHDFQAGDGACDGEVLWCYVHE